MIVISDICRLRNDEKVSPDKIRNPKERVRESEREWNQHTVRVSAAEATDCGSLGLVK